MYSPLKIWDTYWVTITKWKKFVNYSYLLCWFRPHWDDHCLRCYYKLTPQPVHCLLFRRRCSTSAAKIINCSGVGSKNINIKLKVRISRWFPTLEQSHEQLDPTYFNAVLGTGLWICSKSTIFEEYKRFDRILRKRYGKFRNGLVTQRFQ